MRGLYAKAFFPESLVHSEYLRIPFRFTGDHIKFKISRICPSIYNLIMRNISQTPAVLLDARACLTISYSLAYPRPLSIHSSRGQLCKEFLVEIDRSPAARCMLYIGICSLCCIPNFSYPFCLRKYRTNRVSSFACSMRPFSYIFV